MVRDYRTYFICLATALAIITAIVAFSASFVWIIWNDFPPLDFALGFYGVMAGAVFVWYTVKLFTVWTYRDEDFDD